MERNLCWAQIEDFLVIVQTKNAPSNQEWSELIEIAPKMNYLGSLVYTTGGAPTALQRKQLRDAIGDSNARTAILTDSPIARAAITALNLFVKNPLRGFPPDEITEGLSYMKVPPRLWPDFQQKLTQLKQELRIP